MIANQRKCNFIEKDSDQVKGLAMLLVFSTLGLEAFASEEEFISVVEEHDSAEETVSTVEDAKEPLGEVSEQPVEPDSADSRVLGEQILVSTFAELEKAIANASTGNGGAGVENAQGTVTVSGGTISSNRASGILNHGGTVTMSGGSILSNSTTGNEGGIQNTGTPSRTEVGFGMKMEKWSRI